MSRKMQCLIVEDEPLAAEGLEAFIRQVPVLEHAGTCADALSALEVVQQRNIDVLFLDIHLPQLKGLDFLRTLARPPQVIITSAYHQYALEGYELNVVDYLLKPFGLPRFLAAVNKLKIPRDTPETAQEPSPGLSSRPFHFLNENKRQIKVYHDEILYVESIKEYVKIHLKNTRKVVYRCQIGAFEAFFQDPNLLRIHRSFLVAVDKISAFSATEVEIEGVWLPIGRSYQQAVEGVLGRIGG